GGPATPDNVWCREAARASSHRPIAAPSRLTSLAQEINHRPVYPLRLVDVNPVAGPWEAFDADVPHPRLQPIEQLGHQVAVAFSPQDQCRCLDDGQGESAARSFAEESTVIVDRGSQGAGTGQGLNVQIDIAPGYTITADRPFADCLSQQGEVVP